MALTFGVYRSSDDSALGTYTASVSNDGLTPDWKTVSFSFTTSNTVTDTNLYFKVYDTSISGPSTDVAFINASVSAIPEPSTFAAVAGGLVLGAALLRRRRPVQS